MSNFITSESTLQELAERTIKARAWGLCKSMQKKRGGNPFEFSVYYAAKVTGTTEAQLTADIEWFIKRNPMKYSPTTRKLVYTEKAGN